MIQGWFNFAPFYDRVIRSMRDGDTFVEVGVWKGASFVYAMEAAKGKKIRFVAVDHFKGSVGEPSLIQEARSRDLKAEFLRNCEGREFELICGDSVEAANHFDRVDFVFLDGSHDYDSVIQDIDAWLPKVTGVIAGHDYPVVCRAVQERFDRFDLDGTVWYHRM